VLLNIEISGLFFSEKIIDLAGSNPPAPYTLTRSTSATLVAGAKIQTFPTPLDAFAASGFINCYGGSVPPPPKTLGTLLRQRDLLNQVNRAITGVEVQYACDFCVVLYARVCCVVQQQQLILACSCALPEPLGIGSIY